MKLEIFLLRTKEKPQELLRAVCKASLPAFPRWDLWKYYNLIIHLFPIRKLCASVFPSSRSQKCWMFAKKKKHAWKGGLSSTIPSQSLSMSSGTNLLRLHWERRLFLSFGILGTSTGSPNITWSYSTRFSAEEAVHRSIHHSPKDTVPATLGSLALCATKESTREVPNDLSCLHVWMLQGFLFMSNILVCLQMSNQAWQVS